MKLDFHQIVKWIAISGLLILRVVLLGYTQLNTQLGIEWIDPVWELGSYILIVFLIWWEWKNLRVNHFTPLTLIMLIIFPVLSKIILRFFNPNSILVFPKILSFSFLLTAIVLLLIVRHKKIDLRADLGKDTAWFLVFAVIGLAFAVFETFVLIKYMDFPKNPYPGLIALVSPIYQLGYAAPLEECLFRGFLWGGLKEFKIKEFWILIIQTTIFTVGHMYYLNIGNGLLYISMIFVGGLIEGLIVWRTRSLASSISFHAFFNGSSFFLYWFTLLIN